MKGSATFARPCATVITLALLLSSPGLARADRRGHHGPGADGSPMDHGHGKPVMVPVGIKAPALAIAVKNDPVGGWNLHLRVTNFRFAPERASTPHRAGEGHAHLYVNGKKIARLYGPWFHIASLPPGKAVIRVTLNANDHRGIMAGGKPVAATRTVDVPPTKR
ncbi:MAG: hypothetical protein OEO83_08325 [Alphaproteobacteria bacterium]|nr:hypothetical protein [Alphaproteobacteria bacterium]